MNRHFYDEIRDICYSKKVHFTDNNWGNDRRLSFYSPTLYSSLNVRIKRYSNGEIAILSPEGDRMYSLHEAADLGCPVCKEYIARRVFKKFSDLAE